MKQIYFAIFDLEHMKTMVISSIFIKNGAANSAFLIAFTWISDSEEKRESK